MYLFIGFLFAFLIIYIVFTLNINEFVFNLFGITAITFTILFSILYLRRENPFSDHINMTYKNKDDKIKLPQQLPVFSQIEVYLKENHPYTDPRYTITNLAESLKEKESIISEAIKKVEDLLVSGNTSISYG